MSVETIARRYSAALADVVIKNGDTETTKSELKIWQDMIADAGLKNILVNPSITLNNKEKVLEALISKSKTGKTTANFLRILLKNGRLNDLAAINAKFAAVLEERSGNVLAKVTSARELTAAEKSNLQTNLEKLTGKQVKPDFAIDAGIIGGVVTQIGSTVYDSSVRTQLQNLKEVLTAK